MDSKAGVPLSGAAAEVDRWLWENAKKESCFVLVHENSSTLMCSACIFKLTKPLISSLKDGKQVFVVVLYVYFQLKRRIL